MVEAQTILFFTIKLTNEIEIFLFFEKKCPKNPDKNALFCGKSVSAKKKSNEKSFSPLVEKKDHFRAAVTKSAKKKYGTDIEEKYLFQLPVKKKILQIFFFSPPKLQKKIK